jgi:hypothetical protein
MANCSSLARSSAIVSWWSVALARLFISPGNRLVMSRLVDDTLPVGGASARRIDTLAVYTLMDGDRVTGLSYRRGGRYCFEGF